MEYTLVITNGQVVTPDAVITADLAIQDGKIAAIGTGLTQQAKQVLDARGQMVLPGMIDDHVHINEPGRSNWEDYHTGSQALAAGGTTTMLVMPLNALPARTTQTEFDRQAKIAATQSYVDYGLYGGLVPETSIKSQRWLKVVPWAIKHSWQLRDQTSQATSKTLMISNYYPGCTRLPKPACPFWSTRKMRQLRTVWRPKRLPRGKPPFKTTLTRDHRLSKLRLFAGQFI